MESFAMLYLNHIAMQLTIIIIIIIIALRYVCRFTVYIGSNNYSSYKV